MKSVFERKSYKEFLKTWLSEQPNNGHGLKSKLAIFLRCRLAYLSRVLNGDAHLTPEQAARVARFLGLNSVESRYFRLLVDLERAGTADLKEILSAELNELKRSNYSIKARLNIEQPLDALAEQEYYASWQISAAHLALTIPGTDSVEKLAQTLNLPLERTRQLIATLKQCGLITEKSGKLAVTNRVIHGDHRSINARRHLVNWRQKAIDVVQFFEPENLHYSAVVSLSQSDFHKVREILSQSLERSIQTIKSSEEKTLAAINIDWFVF